MKDAIEEIVALLESAYAEKDWEIVLDAIRLLNELPNGNLPCGEDEEPTNESD